MKAAQNNYELDSHAQQKMRGKSMAGKSEAASVIMADETGDDGAVDDDMEDDEGDGEDDEDDEMIPDDAENMKSAAGVSVQHLSTHGLGQSSMTLPGADDCALTGQYVTLVLTGVPLQAVQRVAEGRLFTWFSLFEHEMKVSVLNFNIQRIDGSDEPIKSKQEVIFMVSFLFDLVLSFVYVITIDFVFCIIISCRLDFVPFL